MVCFEKNKLYNCLYAKELEPYPDRSKIESLTPKLNTMQNSRKSLLVMLMAGLSVVAVARSHKSISKEDDSVKVEQVEEVVDVQVDVDVYPNPATENFTISVEDNSFDFALYSKNGRQIISRSDCHETFKMDTSSLSSGVYILNVIVDEDIYMKRIVVL